MNEPDEDLKQAFANLRAHEVQMTPEFSVRMPLESERAGQRPGRKYVWFVGGAVALAASGLFVIAGISISRMNASPVESWAHLEQRAVALDARHVSAILQEPSGSLIARSDDDA